MLALRLAAPKLRVTITAYPQAVVALYSSILIFVMLGSARTFTYHESFTAQGAREMLATGDWLIVRIGGTPWLEKPPLPQWLAAASGKLFGGVSEFSARLPAALAALIGILAVTNLVNRCRDPRAAILTGVFLATMTSIVTYSRLAEPDIFLWAIVTVTLAVFARSHVEPLAEKKWWASAVAFFVLLGLTQTVKGPLFGAVMVLAPCAAWYACHRFHGLKWCLSPFGWLLGIALAIAWPVAVLVQYPETLELWRYHTLGRLDANSAYNPKPFWYYFTTLPWQAAPAILLALPALPRSLKTAWCQPQSLDRFLWLWFVSQFVTLSLASGKHHHYLIYALSPFAVWAAAGVAGYRNLLGTLWSYRGYRFVSICSSLAVLGAASVIAEKQQIVAAWEALAVGGFALMCLVILGSACLRRNNTLAATALAIMLGGIVLYTNVVWLPRTDIYKPDGELAHRIEGITAPDEIVIVYNIVPSGLLLNMDRRIEWIKDDPDALRRAVAARGECVILTAIYYEEEIRGQVQFVEIDRTPHPKWPGRPLSHVIALRAIRPNP